MTKTFYLIKTTLWKVLCVVFLLILCLVAGIVITKENSSIIAFAIFLFVCLPFLITYLVYLSYLMHDANHITSLRQRLKRYYAYKLDNLNDYKTYFDENNAILFYKTLKAQYA